MITTEIEIGKTYAINSSRKGRFTAIITSVNDEWATGTILSGKASAMMDYNEREQGESVTVRRSLCTFTEQS